MTHEEIKIGRRRLGLSQASLARQLGVRRQTVSDWERGVNTPHRIFVRILRELFTNAVAEAGKPKDESEKRNSVPRVFDLF